MIKEIKPAGEIVDDIWNEFKLTADFPFIF